VWYSALGCLVTLTLSLLAAPRAAEAPPPATVPRLGVLSSWSLTTDARHHDAFLQGLHALGYVEGQTIVLEERWAEGHLQRLPDLAAELSGKWLELLKEAVPAHSRVAVLSHPDTPITARAVQALQVAAPPLEIQLQSLSVRDPGELEGAFAAMSREHAEALVVLPGSILSLHSARINELAARSRLPTIWEWREAVAEGGLPAYGPDIASLWRRAATYVDKSLKGTPPGDLPVERPMTFKLVINLKTAQALGLTIPATLLLQADEVIQ
jgi:ABC-type uncharacterized transport system substrate-binding protein